MPVSNAHLFLLTIRLKQDVVTKNDDNLVRSTKIYARYWVDMRGFFRNLNKVAATLYTSWWYIRPLSIFFLESAKNYI